VTDNYHREAVKFLVIDVMADELGLTEQATA